MPGARGLHLAPRPAPIPPACWCRRQSPLYIMLTVEITSELLFYTSPCQNSPQPSDQDKLNTILAVSIFIPFYTCGRMGGRALPRPGFQALATNAVGGHIAAVFSHHEGERLFPQP